MRELIATNQDGRRKLFHVGKNMGVVVDGDSETKPLFIPSILRTGEWIAEKTLKSKVEKAIK